MVHTQERNRAHQYYLFPVWLAVVVKANKKKKEDNTNGVPRFNGRITVESAYHLTIATNENNNTASLS